MVTAVSSQWQTSHMLSLPAEDPVKGAKLAADPVNGFHAVYSSGSIRYRRFINGALQPPVTVWSQGFIPNPNLTVAGNGHIHVVWEDWTDGPFVGWSASFNNGVSFVAAQQRNASSGVKFPLVSHLGASDGPDVLMSHWHAGEKSIRWDLYSGSQRVGNRWAAGGAHSEYQVFGQTRSLQDGTVYRSYGKVIGGVDSVVYQRFNGITWDPEVVVASPGFFARHGIAVNSLGQVMVTWEQDSKLFYRMFTPGAGWNSPGPQLITWGNYSNVTAIPGSVDFYFVYTPTSVDRVLGRRFSGGTWSAAETVSAGQPTDFTPDTALAAGTDGTLYAAWEYWGSGGPKWWYSVRPASTPGPRGTVQGFVRNPQGVGIAGAAVNVGQYSAITRTDGGYTLQLPPGIYTLTASKHLYASHTKPGISVVQGLTSLSDFVISINPPTTVSNLVITPSNNLNRITWRNPSSPSYWATRIRYRTDQHPISPEDGILLLDKPSEQNSNDQLTHTGLVNGVTYYYSFFTRDPDGHYSVAAIGQGTPGAKNIHQILENPDGVVVDLSNKVVTAVFPASNCLYISEPDRSRGLRIQTSSTNLNPGDIVSVTGTTGTIFLSNSASERVINASSITKISTGQPLVPLTMNNMAVGGAAVPPSLPGVRNGVGLNNIGSFVTIKGRVTGKLSNTMWVDDGSGIPDLSGRVGVFVRAPSTVIPANVGDFVKITGVVTGSVPVGWTENRRIVWMRDWTDLVMVGSQ